jgi:hypothetical protein
MILETGLVGELSERGCWPSAVLLDFASSCFRVWIIYIVLYRI